MTTLYVTCGLPGSGKSTWAATQPNVTIVTADDMRTAGRAAESAFIGLYARLRKYLAAGDVIADTCALRVSDRAGLQRMAIQARARAVLVLFATPLGTCQQRDKLRAHPVQPGYDWNGADMQLRQAMRAVWGENWDHVQTVGR